MVKLCNKNDGEYITYYFNVLIIHHAWVINWQGKHIFLLKRKTRRDGGVCCVIMHFVEQKKNIITIIMLATLQLKRIRFSFFENLHT